MKKMVVFNMRTAGYLMVMGFQIKGMDKNKKNPDMDIYIFDDTKELRIAISNYDNFIEINRDYLKR